MKVFVDKVDSLVESSHKVKPEIKIDLYKTCAKYHDIVNNTGRSEYCTRKIAELQAQIDHLEAFRNCESLINEIIDQAFNEATANETSVLTGTDQCLESYC